MSILGIILQISISISVIIAVSHISEVILLIFVPQVLMLINGSFLHIIYLLLLHKSVFL